ncbi:MAG: hypothetical protein IK012_04385 [Fibrobacter sp.]|uniref:hypothetical protein n=1 Tax=Fibrobacter sp. TaxID=35828 RepID=UPI0025BA76F4|nr:hypothetical protein [Fibrobacter sp.]MBR4784475.1 hypothetical protein [Fibrobacter sp.]
MLLFVSSLMARDVLPSYESNREMLLRSNYKFEGKRTRIYDNAKTLEFEIYCSKWFETKYPGGGEIDSLKRCSLIAKGNKSSIDSNIHNQGEYELFERIYDAEGRMSFYRLVESHWTTIDRYESGRLVSHEDWCDTIRTQKNSLCRSPYEERGESIKPDSLGLFLTNQIRYVWDEKGRLKQRILWELGNPYGLNGTYEFIYKSPCDPVKVVPEDREWGWDAMQKGRYDGTFGKIPEVGDPEYNSFAEDPYPSMVLDGPGLTPFNSDESQKTILERQKKRCEDYKKSLKKSKRK